MVDRPAITIATAIRPSPGEVECGDAWQIDWSGDKCRISVIDGLGHGHAAAAASSAARETLAAHPTLDPARALQECHVALHNTRGAAMWTGTIDFAEGKIAYAEIGNVEGALWQGGRRIGLVGQRGIVGAVLPHMRIFEQPLERDWLLTVYTDGIRGRAGADDLPEHLRSDPQMLVDRLLLAWGRATDDALILAARAA